MSIRDHKAIILQRVIQISYGKYPDNQFYSLLFNKFTIDFHDLAVAANENQLHGSS